MANSKIMSAKSANLLNTQKDCNVDISKMFPESRDFCDRVVLLMA